jgi:hypothetical protein
VRGPRNWSPWLGCHRTGGATCWWGATRGRRPVGGRLAAGWQQRGRGWRRALCHGDLLQDQGRADLQKYGEVPGQSQVATASKRVMNDFEHQRAVTNGLAKVANDVCHVLEAPAVIRDDRSSHGKKWRNLTSR